MAQLDPFSGEKERQRTFPEKRFSSDEKLETKLFSIAVVQHGIVIDHTINGNVTVHQHKIKWMLESLIHFNLVRRAIYLSKRPRGKRTQKNT